MRIKSKVAPSDIHGVGCFAEEPIQKGGLVWEFDHGIDRELSHEEFSQFPEVTKGFIQSHAWASPHKTILISFDHGGHFNHADNSNTTMSESGLKCFATRDINAGTS